jgi:TolB protein
MPGAAKHRVDARTLKFIEPVGTLTISVVDERGRPLVARVSVTGADGRSWAPQSALMHADDSFDRSARRYEVGYYHTSGASTLMVPAGPVTVEVTRGLEYAVSTHGVQIGANGARVLRVTMRRLVNLPASGWYSGDLHVHMNYGGSYRTVPQQLAFMARAEDVHVIEELIVNKEQRVPDISYFGHGAPDPVSTPATLIVHGQEFHTSYWGHSGLLGLKSNIILPGYAAYANTPAASLYPANANVFDLGHAQGALTGYVHPFDELPNPEDTVSRVTSELPVDVALGKVDYMEIVGFSDHRSTAAVWYRLLNCGFRIPAGAGTDAMTNFASLRGPVGMNRVYVHSGDPLNHESYLRALKTGHSFATNGPLLSLAVNGKEPGSEIKFPLGSHTISVRVTMHSIVPVEHLELVQNGKVVATVPLSASGKSASTMVNLPVCDHEPGVPHDRGNSAPVARRCAILHPVGRTSARGRGAAHRLQQRGGKGVGTRPHFPSARRIRKARVRDRRLALDYVKVMEAGERRRHARACRFPRDSRRRARRSATSRSSAHTWDSVGSIPARA